MRTDLFQSTQLDAPERAGFLYPSEGFLDHLASAQTDGIALRLLVTGH